MRKITQKALTVTAVAAAAAALTALPASARMAPVDVSLPGVTPPSADEPITGENNGSVVAFNTRTGAVLSCDDTTTTKALTAQGTVDVGTGLSATGIGSVTGLTFSNCTVNSLPANVTADTTTSWSLNVTGTTTSGVTPGQLLGVKVHVDIPSLSCEADFQGPNGTGGFIDGQHTNPANPGDPSVLDLPFGATNNLVAQNVDTVNCPTNLVANGDGASLSGAIHLRGVNATNNEGPTVIS
ncbi:hypothetical protein [Actinomadura sp. 3N407]|uniref:hypothetical protein n=1 Tax=Actinomadura sp. 3N407 TaxID=3457423 RepID=UPI003FCC61E0